MCGAWPTGIVDTTLRAATSTTLISRAPVTNSVLPSFDRASPCGRPGDGMRAISLCVFRSRIERVSSWRLPA